MNWRLSAAVAALALISSTPVLAASGAYMRPIMVAGLFGESDEEKEARLKAEQRENDQDAGISELRQRVQDLTNALQQSTGENERLAGQIRDLNARIDQQRKDFDYKLCTLAAQQLGTGTSGSTGGLPCEGTGVAPVPAGPQFAPSEQQPPQASGPPPASGGTLGTLPASGATSDANATKAQYDEAMNLLARARYDEARAAFRAFADQYPKDPLAPQAVNWVGNVAFVQKDYAAAAQAFAEQIKKYPTSPQGAESMLKLGLSLIQLGEKKEGCVTLGAIKGKYKQAPATILTQAGNARAEFCPKER